MKHVVFMEDNKKKKKIENSEEQNKEHDEEKAGVTFEFKDAASADDLLKEVEVEAPAAGAGTADDKKEKKVKKKKKAKVVGNVLAWSSAGRVGFRGPKKATPYAASVVVRDLVERLKPTGLREVDVIIKGVGPGREGAVRAIQTNGVNVLSV